ncbi:putative transcriptional regulator [Mycolicibacterium chubuense NBB4]|uniref:Putative transcriptional regulator n=1 Tax=Mycolicibacterium chubuense (strain NBB4) TaxID=710421 RepID=I4BLY4_MYCCN|nr:MerR family transcriptional regulator [Mycolicibacterium chubuense]AFM18291.1 putative transcriptional regulator [Mycolicibacterium chubuense NBB4]
MAEYRLEELAKVSGVSTRNIRAYRERGLLDPPRRVGRSALYDDYHLSQLNTISQLLRKGFNSAHIAEFFESMRQGADLADILGLQRAVLGTQPEEAPRTEAAVGIEPDSEEARKLVSYGMAEIDEGRLTLVDGAAEILAKTPDQLVYVRALLRFLEAADSSIDHLAEMFVNSLVDLYRVRVGPDYLPKPQQMDEIRRVIQDYRVLGERVMTARFERATRKLLVASASDYTAGILLTGAWEPKHTA